MEVVNSWSKLEHWYLSSKVHIDLPQCNLKFQTQKEPIPTLDLPRPQILTILLC